MGRQSSTADSEDAISSIVQESGFFPPWLWLTLLTIFMALVLWLCLRNITHLLPLKIQRILQDLVDRAFGRGRIRLLDDSSYSVSENRRPGIPMGLEGDSDDEAGDDELPQFSMHSTSRTRGIAGTLQASKDRIEEEAILSLVAGRSRRFRRLPAEEDAEGASERILVLPNISSRHTTNTYKPKLALETNGSSTLDASRQSSRPTSTLFRRDSANADAPPLPSSFNINHHQSSTRHHGRAGSGSGDRTPPLSARSPTIRSPALSRTPSLLAIAEEASVSPPAPSTAKPFSYIRRKSSSSASASSGSSEQGFQDWASAVSGTSRRRDGAFQDSP